MVETVATSTRRRASTPDVCAAREPHAQIGSIAPDIETTSVASAPFTLVGLRDKPVLLDPDDRWSAAHGVTGQPETFFINTKGILVAHLIGPLTQAQMALNGAKAGMKS